MAKTALKEGFDDIADWFETLAKAERSHANRFQTALDSLPSLKPGTPTSTSTRRRILRERYAAKFGNDRRLIYRYTSEEAAEERMADALPLRDRLTLVPSAVCLGPDDNNVQLGR